MLKRNSLKLIYGAENLDSARTWKEINIHEICFPFLLSCFFGQDGVWLLDKIKMRRLKGHTEKARVAQLVARQLAVPEILVQNPPRANYYQNRLLDHQNLRKVFKHHEFGPI